METQPVAPAPVEAPAVAPAPAAPVAPAVDAGLAAAIADHSAKIRGSTVPEPVARPPEQPLDTLITGNQPAKAEGEAPPAEGEAAQKAEPAPEPVAAKEEPQQDAVATSIARYLRETRLAREERARLAKERETLKAAPPVDTRAMEALQRFEAAKAKNPVLAVEELLGDEALKGTFVLDLLDHLKRKEDGEVMTPERQADLAAQRAVAAIEAKQAAEREAAAKAQAAREAEKEAQNKEAFFTGLKAEFSQKAEKYPYLAAAGVDTSEIDAAVSAHYKATREIPTPDMIFQHFEQIKEKEAQKYLRVAQKKAGNVIAPVAQAKPAPSAPVPATVDSRGKPVTPSRPETVREQRERIAAALDQAARR